CCKRCIWTIGTHLTHCGNGHTSTCDALMVCCHGSMVSVRTARQAFAMLTLLQMQTRMLHLPCCLLPTAGTSRATNRQRSTSLQVSGNTKRRKSRAGELLWQETGQPL